MICPNRLQGGASVIYFFDDSTCGALNPIGDLSLSVLDRPRGFALVAATGLFRKTARIIFLGHFSIRPCSWSFSSWRRTPPGMQPGCWNCCGLVPTESSEHFCIDWVEGGPSEIHPRLLQNFCAAIVFLVLLPSSSAHSSSCLTTWQTFCWHTHFWFHPG